MATWDTSRRQAIAYSRRRPEETALYRLVYHHRDEFERSWPALFEHKYGALRHEVLEAFDAYLNCGILFCGAARAYCPSCKHSQLIAFSCKRRGLCPSCDAKRGVLFAEHLHEHVLRPLPHRHLTFSIPKRLRVYFKYDRKLTALLYRAAWDAWRQFVAESIPGAGAPAMVAALHTAGDLLNFHPHVHALALDGALDQNGQFRQLVSVDTEKLEASFQRLVFQSLAARELITEDTVTGMSAWQHSGFNVHTTEPIAPDDSDHRRFIARYLKKPPLSLQRLQLIESDSGTVVRIVKHLDDSAAGSTQVQTRDLSPLEFLAELSTHIPDIREQTTRYYGAYAARTRGAKKHLHPFAPIAKAAAAAAATLPPIEQSRPASRGWAACIKRVFEVDPLVCPNCGERMKIVAFITDSKQLTKLCANLGLHAWRAPPPLRRTPSQQQLVLD